MKNKFIHNTGQGQFRLVILLVAIAVILPTVCLLWFMTQAVKNERLAARQKLINVYKEKTRPLIEHLQQRCLEFEQEIQRVGQSDTFSLFTEFCCDKGYAEGVLIYDSNNHILFPKSSDESNFIDTEIFEKGWRLEFIDSNYLEAASEYEQAIKVSSIPYKVFHGKLAMIRCYEKAENIEKAVNICRELAYPEEHIVDEYTSSDIIQARLKLVQLYQKQNTSVFEKETALLLSNLIGNTKKKPLPSEVRVFVLSELLKLIDNSQLPQLQQENIAKAQKILKAETLSLHAIDNLLTKSALDKLQEKRFGPIDLSKKTYGMLYKTKNRKVVLLAQRSSIVRVLKDIAEKLSDSTSAVSVFDEHNNPVFGENKNAGKAFLTIRPGDFWGEWKLCFFFHNSEVFDNAASKQAAIYTWTGVLVALLILASGLFAAGAVSRQIKLNRLKNDFIATVTHELKTPLASMRVLADTLLEGNYNDQKQATEYLQLISKENARLSRLIDNFLTFSRMERNKQAFDIIKADPVEIAKNAAEAVRTKFNKENCKFTVGIDDNLPSVMVDKDAMITVLVNLLDNAYKYSLHNRQIELKVFSADNFVCFSVKDNGIGMTRRQIRKAFDRFYQADSSLARTAEGTGLGLSIVKFIVDAHKGQIAVESKPETGSTFTVKLPTD
jgi:signal transduction histidine kinase